MVIVKFIGGLGNQMFQYAFYRFLESKNAEVQADISDMKLIIYIMVLKLKKFLMFILRKLRQ